MKTFSAVLLLVGLTSTALAASPGDWTSYGRDAGGGRFSPLTGITPANVGKLAVAWTYHMDPFYGREAPAGTSARRPASETTPLEVDGVIYLGTPYGRVVALDATTGKEIWAYDLPKGNQPSERGLAYWPGDGRSGAEIVFGTMGDGKLIALRAKTGEPVQSFANAGILDINTADVMNGFAGARYDMTAPPAIYKNLVILTARVQEAPTLGPSGNVRAFDLRTGKLAWTFHSIPQPGEKFHDTWEGDSWVKRSGVNVWNMMTVDSQRGIVYMAFGAPAIDRFGGDRHGANLFSDSIVAADAATGKYLWHFQVTHHDIWDYDMDTPPVLVTIKKDGKVIPALVAMNKAGILFLLNRVTGEPVYPVTETPVPASDIPGEQAWPTQPIPSAPPQLTRSGFALNEVATVTPQLHDYCQSWIDRDHIQPTVRYQPYSAKAPVASFPAGEGGPEWAGGAFDPQRGLFIINTNEMAYIVTMTRNPDGTYKPGTRHFALQGNAMLCQQPPWGDLTAIDVNTGAIAWRHNFGVTDSLPEGMRDTGRPNTGGPIVTASGLTFIGATDDARFRAYDTGTGKELWSTTLEFPGHATPVTYQRNGRQYVAIVATGGSALGSRSGGDSLVAFALPSH
jgi:quinoprotein glucose dehydrogenase